ncbi:MAG: pyrroline-5-carboxylate reductase [Pirellulales bacterium]
MLRETIGFIGAGEMARALGGGFVAAGLLREDQLWAADPRPEGREEFAGRLPEAHVVAENTQVAEAADIIFLAVKPQHIRTALADLREPVGSRHLVISIAAGVALSTIAEQLSDRGPEGGPRLVRVMPNTPCLVGQSASGYCLGRGATPEDGRVVRKLLEAVGVAFELPEKLLDAVTGLAGSGPAYVYMMIEALSDGGVAVGLPRDVSAALAVQTVRGAAQMVLQSGEHPAALKDRVASPGGTTIAGLAELERGRFRAALIGAVRAATERSIELGKS